MPPRDRQPVEPAGTSKRPTCENRFATVMTDRTAHQTLSFLRQRLSRAGIQLRTEQGQNFLIDINLLKLLVRTAELGPGDVVLEVGTGVGSLTGLMAPLVAAVVTVEVDHRLARLASEELHGRGNVILLEQDALENKKRLSPAVLQAVDQQLSAAPGRTFKLVANLPFHIATPILTNLLALEQPPRTMTVTIQKEVADRLIARPATKDYGSLSIWVQSQCRVRLVRTMPPAAFWPRPKVHSAIVHVELDDALRARIADLDFFHQFTRAVFLHRRKLLRSELAAVYPRLDKPTVDRVLAELDLGPSVRAEELSVDQMLALANAVRARAAA